MRHAPSALLAGLLAAALATPVAAQPAAPASGPVPVAASSPTSTRNAAVRAAENAKEPGAQRPEQRVFPQLHVPLTRRGPNAAAPASAPTGPLVDDGAARCLASRDAPARAACERALAASAPARPASRPTR
jgi:hypothetical protein